jgi:hypothetical protein
MDETLQRLNQALGPLAAAPQALGRKVEALKASPGGRRLIALDARAGRLFSRAVAAGWLAACAGVLAAGYGLSLVTSGWVETAVLAALAVPFLYALMRGVSHLRAPRAASEIILDEIEDRVAPARWILRVAGLFTGRKGTPAD